MVVRKYLKGKSVLRTWTCSYILIFSIFLIAVFANYGISTKALKEEVIKVNELSFNNVSDNVDYLLKLLRSGYVSVFLNEGLSKLSKQDMEDPSFYRRIKTIQDELYDYSDVENKFFCMVYIKDIDYLVGGLNSCAANRYYGSMQYLYKDFIGYDEWKEILAGSYKEDYLVTEGVNFWTSGKCMMYASTINRNHGEEYNIIISIPLERIESALRYLKEDAWFVIHMDGQPSAVFYDGKMTQAPEWVENENFCIRMQKESAVPGVSYELIFLEQDVKEALQGTRINFWMNLIFTILLALGGMIILLRINYRPIRTIIDEIGEEEKHGNQNEYEIIKRLFERLISENRKTEQMIEQQNKELMNSRLLMMMKGRGNTIWKDGTEEKSIPLINQGVAMVGFMIPVLQDKAGCDVNLQFFIIDNIFSELMEKKRFYHVEDGSFSLYLLDLDTDTAEEWRTDVAKKMEIVCSMLYDNWGISVIGVVGKEGENIDDIKYLYRNMMEAFEYGKVVGGHGVIDIRILPDCDEFHIWEDNLERRFREAFEEKDVTAALTGIRQIFGKYHIANMSLTAMKIRVHETFRKVMDVFGEYISDISLKEKAFGYLERLINSQTEEELLSCFEELLEFQVGAIAGFQVKEGKSIVTKVIDYVQENYTDCNLNLNTLAEALGKNSRYISRTFKQETDTGILDYINSMRIEKARELMATGKYTMQEAADAVGYTNLRTFRRTYEKIAGHVTKN